MYYRMRKDNAELWRWVFYAANHEPIGISSESYINKSDCLHAITLMKASASSPVYHDD